MRVPYTVNQLSEKMGQMMGPQHPRAQAMMREQGRSESEAGAGPPNYRDAEPDGPSCSACRDFMPNEGGEIGKCMRYGTEVMAGKVCDQYTPETSGNPDADAA